MRIMVVDDDSTTLAICKGLLETEYEVDLMNSGLQALGFLMESEDKRPDLILMEMAMPGTSGIDALLSIRKTEALASIPIIFLSSQKDDWSELEGYRNGADDFIKKPILPDLLKWKVKRQLAIAGLRRENAALKSRLNRIRVMVGSICSEKL